MDESTVSRTALRVAARRAAHQILDHPLVFEDPLALAIVGEEAARKAASETWSPSLRAFLVARSRFAEDELAHAVARGIRQYVVLGAGLDTFAYRNPHAALGLRVFEVDHPSTQEWKRDRLRSAGIEIPAETVFAAVDFGHQSLGDALPSAGFRAAEPAFFSWLGVVPYLTEDAFLATMAFIAGLPPASGVVFDYVRARSALSGRERLALDALASRVAAAGEPFQLFFEPAALAAQVRRLGFHHLEDLESAEINARYFRNRADGLSIRGSVGHLLSARI